MTRPVGLRRRFRKERLSHYLASEDSKISNSKFQISISGPTQFLQTSNDQRWGALDDLLFQTRSLAARPHLDSMRNPICQRAAIRAFVSFYWTTNANKFNVQSIAAGPNDRVTVTAQIHKRQVRG